MNVVDEIEILGKAVNLIFPHQLFAESPLLSNGHELYLVEEHLFFRQYQFHKQKLAFHRASMQYYKNLLAKKNLKVTYIDASHPLADIRQWEREITAREINEIHLIDPVDDWLMRRIKEVAAGIKLNIIESPMFLNDSEVTAAYFRKDKKKFFQTDFYKRQRKRLDLLLDKDGEPLGGKWTFDADNRKKYPKSKTPPAIHVPGPSTYWDEALIYVEKFFKDNPGKVAKTRLYPVTHNEAQNWLTQFLEYRFYDFGIYEDAMVSGHSFLNHSILSPLINSGLLTPQAVIKETLDFIQSSEIPLNSIEGFIRQIIGWREFIRGIYEVKGRYSRTKNFWGFENKIPNCFYDGTTGIVPVDETIGRVLDTGYAHHIERLIVLGNFMLLCEFHPDEVYRWFMELFIDAYDWVMVPNVYGMSQFADGGSFASKPYIAGSNYLQKMSNFPPGQWQETWDGLFWRFIVEQGDFFKSNPRISMLYYSSQKMSREKLDRHYKNANNFLEKLLS